jgi:hypothetical protein
MQTSFRKSPTTADINKELLRSAKLIQRAWKKTFSALTTKKLVSKMFDNRDLPIADRCRSIRY